MKYKNTVNQFFKVKANYFVMLILIILPLVFVSCFSFVFKQTIAWISGNTAVLDYPYRVYYSSNWPDDIISEDHIIGYGSFRSHIVLGSDIFTFPLGYEFVSWNTSIDGSGNEFNENDVMTVKENTTLYAIWKKINDDIIDDGNDEGDNDSSLDDKEENSDVPSDNPDNPDNPEVENPNLGNGDNSDMGSSDSENTDDNIENEGENGSGATGTGSSGGSGTGSSGGSGSGTGSGSSSGSGNGNSSSGGNSSSSGGSSGSTGNSSHENNSSTGNSNSNNNDKNNVTNNDSDNKNDVEEETFKTYKFKFVSEGKEFANYECNVLKDESCELILPKDLPTKEGYTFVGWSLSTLCFKENIINSSIKVNGDNIYYACFKINTKNTSNGGNWIYLVISIWIIASISIYFIIKRFRKNVQNEEID